MKFCQTKGLYELYTGTYFYGELIGVQWTHILESAETFVSPCYNLNSECRRRKGVVNEWVLKPHMVTTVDLIEEEKLWK